ncbi:MAG: Cell wall surface anchored protein [Parcubacteria group bacterium GW2011_GWA2_42_28]|nr:MAG: Cell wall surface anchored protein [Parcubacteria group bacterium GW2011_GWA2_42_28]HIG97290.1 hypothetical protein [Candidatus Aenigmarchaeota archaeon]
MKKFIVLVICALIGMLSIPHVSLWNFSVGSETVNAATTQKTYPSNSPVVGSVCGVAGKDKCLSSNGQFRLGYCQVPQWKIYIPLPDESYDSCLNRCNPRYDCIEPYIELTAPISETVPRGTVPLIKSVTNYPASEISSHNIEVNPGNNGWTTITCSSRAVCEHSNAYTNLIDGTTVQFYSEISLNDGTYIRNPKTGEYTYTLSSGTTCTTPSQCTTPPANECNGNVRTYYTSPGTCTGGSCTYSPQTETCTTGCTLSACVGGATPAPSPGTGLTFNPASPITVAVGETSSAVTVTGATGAISTDSLTPSGKVTVSYSVTSFTVRGDAAGTASLVIKDSSNKKTSPITITVNPAGGGAPGGWGVQINPAKPSAGQQFTITFSIPSTSVTSLLYQITGGPTSVSIGTASGCLLNSNNGMSCTAYIGALSAGTYTISNVNYKEGNNILKFFQLSPNPYSFEVTASGTPGTSTNRCCVYLRGSEYEYKNDQTEAKCDEEGGSWKTTSCTNAGKEQCNDYCRLNQFGTSGTCSLSPGTQSRTDKVCYGNEKCVCQGTAQQDAANVPCASACYTASGVTGYLSPAYSTTASSFPIGQCTDNPQALYMAIGVASAVATSGASSSRQPISIGNPGQHGCGLAETCWCTFVNTASFTANTQTAATLPGTQTAGTWTHPNDITASAPRATPNDHDCSAASNATITASLGIAGTTQTSGTSSTTVSRLIQAGETVTITGNVAKLSDTCNGYNYTCTTMQQLGCELHNRVLWNSLSYKDCPAGTTLIPGSAQGDGITPNWRLIAAAVIIAVTWGAAAAAAGPLTSAFYTGQTVQGAVFTGAVSSAVGAAINGANCGGNNANAGTGVANTINQQWQVAAAQAARSAAAQAAGDAAAQAAATAAIKAAAVQGASQAAVEAAAAQAAQAAIQTGASSAAVQAVANAAATEALKSSATEATVNAAAQTAAKGSSTAFSPYAGFAGIGTSLALNALPTCPTQDEIIGCFSVCGKTYNTAVAASPLCNQGGPVIGFTAATYPCATGTCGAYASKRVKIDIRGPDGLTAIEDYVTTDSLGDFSYTFQAPAADGEFTAIVSVPRD